MNYFSEKETAKGYAADRPYFHPVVIRHIKSYLNITKVNTALDVGCGAGLSTLALLDVAQKVVGTDSSQAMIDSAIEHERIKYFNYPAESLPFADKFNLITLAGSINWIDRKEFFSQAKKCLCDDSYIVIYDNNICGEMEGEPRFEKWYWNTFLDKYPTPPRDETRILKDEATRYGFDLEHSENYTNQVQFNIDGFIRYLCTQSNITTVLNKKIERASDIQQWLYCELKPFFNNYATKNNEQSIRFAGYIWYLRKETCF